MKQNKYSANTLVGIIVFITVVFLLYYFFINSNTGSVTDEATTVTRVNATYKILSNAFAQALKGHGVRIEQWYTDNTNENAAKVNSDRKTVRIAQNFFESMPIAKTCGMGGNCFSSAQPTSILGYEFKNFSNKTYNAILTNGVSVGVRCNEVYCTIYFDIDGPKKGLNMYGVDIFSVKLNPSITLEKLITTDSANVQDEELEELCKGKFGQEPDSSSCTAYVLKNQNLSYAKNILK